MKIKVTVELEFDAKAWAELYGIREIQAPADVRYYFTHNVMQRGPVYASGLLEARVI